MSVAFYLDNDSPEFISCAEKAVAAVRRHMPQAQVVQLTTEEGPELAFVDRVHRCGHNDVPFGYRRNHAASSMEGDVLFLDVDVIVQADLSKVFEKPFDIAVTTDVLPGSRNIRFDGGVAFSRCPQFWRELRDAVGTMDFRKTAHDYAPLMEAYTSLIESRKYKVLVLPGERYNCVPVDPRATEGALLLHYRGPRKSWLMLHNSTPAALERAHEVARRLPANPVKGAEIGVWRGYMSAALMWRPDVTLYMVDDWKEHPYSDGRVAEGYSASDQPENYQASLVNTAFASRRRTILKMDSSQAARAIPDGSLDFVFIDADHSYEGVKRDIGAWFSKLAPGALLGGHDYDNPDESFGADVKRAVDEAVERNGWTLDLGRQTTWFVRI